MRWWDCVTLEQKMARIHKIEPNLHAMKVNNTIDLFTVLAKGVFFYQWQGILYACILLG